MAASDHDVELYAAKTGTDTAGIFVVRDRPITVYHYGTHTAAEDTNIQRQAYDGTWHNEVAQTIGGTSEALVLTEERTSVTIYGGGTYRLNKPTTTNAIGAAYTMAPRL